MASLTGHVFIDAHKFIEAPLQENRKVVPDPIKYAYERGIFSECVQRAIDVQIPGLVVVADVDNLSYINKFGGEHEAGDDALRAGYSSFQAIGGIAISRLGGDEVGGIIPAIAEHSETCYQDIRDAMNELFHTDFRLRLFKLFESSIEQFGREPAEERVKLLLRQIGRYGLSIGIAPITPNTIAENLIRAADINAMQTQANRKEGHISTLTDEERERLYAAMALINTVPGFDAAKMFGLNVRLS